MRIVSIFLLLEKSGLCSSLFGFQKVAQTDADEPITLLWTQGHSRGATTAMIGSRSPPSLINNVGQTFVMGVGQVPLKRSRLDGTNWQNGNQNGMAAQWFFVGADHTAASFLHRGRNLFCGTGRFS